MKAAGSKVLGRDHFPDAFTMVLAGGAVKGGLSYGESDELGFSVASQPVHVHDLQATLLHILGMDHTRLTYPHQGLDHRLTSVTRESHVVTGVLA